MNEDWQSSIASYPPSAWESAKMFETQWRGSRTLTSRTFLPVGLKSPAAPTVLVFVASASDSKSEEGSSTLPDRANFQLDRAEPSSRRCQTTFFLVLPKDGYGLAKVPCGGSISMGLRIKAVHWPLKPREMERYHQPQPRGLVFSGAWFFQNPSWRNWQSRKAQTFHVVGSNPADGTTPSSPIGSRQGT